MKHLALLLTLCLWPIELLTQSNTIATDTIRINGQAGAVNLITGSQTRTLNFPAGSGTLALEATVGSDSIGCCCGDITTHGTFPATVGRSYTPILDTRGMKNALVFYVTGVYYRGLQSYVGYETAPDSTGPWFTFVEMLMGRDGISVYDPPIFMEVRPSGVWGLGNRDCGAFLHSGTSAQVRLGGGAAIFRYVRAFIRNVAGQFDYVLRVY
jgi:hypothetical protein